MSKTSSVRARIEPELKEKAERVFQDLGLSPTQAIRLFYKQVELRNGLPFAGLDSRIQIHKIPVQLPGQFPPNAALAGTHESHKEYRAHFHGSPWNAAVSH